MYILVTLLTLFFAGICLVIGTISALKNSATKKQNDSADKNQDEEPDIWQLFGLVDDTPNVIYGVVGGWSGKGPIKDYLTNDEIWDKTTKRFRPVQPTDNYLKGGELGQFIYRISGSKRIYGWPIINSLKPLMIDRVVQVDTSSSQENIASEKMSLQKELTAHTVRRYGLYREIIRPTFHINLDAGDGVRFSVISSAIIEIVNPEPAFRKYPDSLLQNISRIVSGFLSSEIIRIDWEEYKRTGKHGHKFDDLSDLQKLLEPLGAEIKQLTMGDPELNKSIQDAMEAKAKAKEAGKAIIETAAANARARVKTARGEQIYIRATGQANADVTKMQAEANKERVRVLAQMYKEQGCTESEALEKAISTILTQDQAEAIGKVQGTVVFGKSGIGFNIQGGDKK